MTAQLDFTYTSTQTMHHGDCLEIMKTMPDNSIDFICTDPPYGLHFMGKSWDSAISTLPYWQEMFRICKPGSHLAAFGGSRTHHRIMSMMEDAGFEIRDVIMWIYGQGFPKSHNNFGLPGYGTALKPAYEPIILAMKPLDGTYAQNAQKWGLAGINIEESRIETKEELGRINNSTSTFNYKNTTPYVNNSKDKGRWPANLILDEESAQMLDQQSGINASRFFYCAKASSAERNKGLEKFPAKECQTGCSGAMPIDDNGIERDRFKKICQNHHPTVKPIVLMKYIIKLLAPPNNPTLLDPFAGSGTTLLAAKFLDINAIGIEKELEYYNIAKARIENG